MASEHSSRMTDPGNPPGDSKIADWIGTEAYRYWKRTVERIEQLHPNVFGPEWLFSGKKHGWSLRYKKSKSFCTLIPEKNRFSMLIVFGTEERTKVEGMRDSLTPCTRKEYDKATTYHDGKWLLLAIDSENALKDAFSLLAVKRKPKASSA
jgi:hypothetical protein